MVTTFVNLFTTLMADLIIVLLIMFIIFLALWRQRSIFLKALAVPVCMVYGLSQSAGADGDLALWVVGVVLALVGMYFLYQIVMMAFGWAED